MVNVIFIQNNDAALKQNAQECHDNKNTNIPQRIIIIHQMAD